MPVKTQISAQCPQSRNSRDSHSSGHKLRGCRGVSLAVPIFIFNLEQLRPEANASTVSSRPQLFCINAPAIYTRHGGVGGDVVLEDASVRYHVLVRQQE